MTRNRRQPKQPRVDPERGIPPERKALYYIGLFVTVIGFLLFLSVFVSSALNFGNFDDFHDRTRSEGLRALAGMALIIVGGVLQQVGSQGLAGSGVILDPEKAREDLEPWSRMAGGIVKDGLSEIRDAADGEPAQPEVKVRCQQCRTLNDEDAQFCKKCGQPL